MSFMSPESAQARIVTTENVNEKGIDKLDARLEGHLLAKKNIADKAYETFMVNARRIDADRERESSEVTPWNEQANRLAALSTKTCIRGAQMA